MTTKTLAFQIPLIIVSLWFKQVFIRKWLKSDSLHRSYKKAFLDVISCDLIADFNCFLKINFVSNTSRNKYTKEDVFLSIKMFFKGLGLPSTRVIIDLICSTFVVLDIYKLSYKGWWLKRSISKAHAFTLEYFALY